MTSYTNTALSTDRRCHYEWYLRYELQLEPEGADSEALQVGHTWHRAHDWQTKGRDPFEAITKHAPGDLWREKIGRLFAAYDWYWKDQRLNVVESEHTFKVEINGVVYEGQLDGIVEIPDGRKGILERKTAGFGLESESTFWDRLRMDVQVGIYSMACGFVPDFILYDVVRKPTINPKKLLKADVARLGKELADGHWGRYHDENFSAEQLAIPLEQRRESVAMYGARLTADIGDRPAYYFARRDVPRTASDYETLLSNIDAQVRLIEYAKAEGCLHRNPDSCATFGQCAFFALCSNNIRPVASDEPPTGYRRREHLHPELQPQDSELESATGGN